MRSKENEISKRIYNSKIENKKNKKKFGKTKIRTREIEREGKKM